MSSSREWFAVVFTPVGGVWYGPFDHEADAKVYAAYARPVYDSTRNTHVRPGPFVYDRLRDGYDQVITPEPGWRQKAEERRAATGSYTHRSLLG